MSFKKLIIGFLLSWVMFFQTLSITQAAEDFTTTLQTTYTISSSGQTQVKHSITITNKTPTLYASQYGLKVSSPSIKNVKVLSNGEVLIPEIVTSENQTSIGITFPDQIVGEGKERKVELEYLYTDATVISGKVLEVLVPKLAGADVYDSYQVSLITPAEYGRPTRATPVNYETREDGNRVITTFNPRNGESVTALFGQEQIFELRLRYNLPNTSTNPGIAQIALPPDTAHQQLDYQVLEPRPQNLALDADGNWIATYEVPPKSEIAVYAVAKTLITLSPSSNFASTTPSPQLTQGQEFWETTHPSVTELLSQFDNPRSIYDYVVKTLSYNYQPIEDEVIRLGAVNSIAHSDQARCQEFTDLFVTFSRAKNIPARRITGYAYTQNSVLRPTSVDTDILHAWPEYFNQKTGQWHQIDPTWENTTGGVNYFDQFDLNHIVFAINGESSTLPFPAGSYKLDTQNNRDVEVVFSSNYNYGPLDIHIQQSNDEVGRLQIPGNNQISISNNTGKAWYNLKIKPKNSAQNLIFRPELIEIPVLLPFQTLSVPLRAFSSQTKIVNQSDLEFEVEYSQDIRSRTQSPNQVAHAKLVTRPITISVGNHHFQNLTYHTSIIGLGVGSLLITGLAGSILVLRLRRSRTVRRKS